MRRTANVDCGEQVLLVVDSTSGNAGPPMFGVGRRSESGGHVWKKMIDVTTSETKRSSMMMMMMITMIMMAIQIFTRNMKRKV